MKLTYARALRIQEALLTDARFIGKLGEANVELERRDGTKTMFFAKVVLVAEELQTRGVDSNICKKDDIFSAGVHVLAAAGAQPEGAVSDTPVVSAAPAAPVAAAPVAAAEKPRATAATTKLDVKWSLPVYSLLVAALAVAERDKSAKSQERLPALRGLVSKYETDVTTDA